MQKINKFFKVWVFLVIAVAILSFTVVQSGIINLGGTNSSSSTIAPPLSRQGGTLLAWDCPTCPG